MTNPPPVRYYRTVIFLLAFLVIEVALLLHEVHTI